MRNIINRLILTLLILTCIGSVAIPVYADTDGTELQVVEPQKLEIQLGQSWAGVEFTLKTDAGMYPNAIPVDETGVLKLEIGGAKVMFFHAYSHLLIFPIRITIPLPH